MTYDIHLFTRNPELMSSFLAAAVECRGGNLTVHSGYSKFEDEVYDVIINCVGVGTLKKMLSDFTQYFSVGEQFDNLVINYLKKKGPESLYISFSSGSIYGKDHSEPVNEHTCNCITVNSVQKEDYYSITRLYTEAKHRAFEKLNIVDLRVFSFFSKYIDLGDGYFITEILNSIIYDKTLITDSRDMVRDYLHPDDLFSMIEACIRMERVNGAYDVVSAKPVSKTEILKLFSSEFGLKYTVCDFYDFNSATGRKNHYSSEFREAAKIGYVPRFSSLDTLRQETRKILLR